LTATAAGGTSHRDAQLGDTITQLRATRFPLMGVAGRGARRLVVAGGFTTYLDRSWDVALRDSTVLRGELERYRDEITSDGSVGDIRVAAASRLSRRLAIGAGIHILAGSTRMTAVRRFDDSTFHTVGQVAEVRYDGFGVAGSVRSWGGQGRAKARWAGGERRRRRSARRRRDRGGRWPGAGRSSTWASSGWSVAGGSSPSACGPCSWG